MALVTSFVPEKQEKLKIEIPSYTEQIGINVVNGTHLKGLEENSNKMTTREQFTVRTEITSYHAKCQMSFECFVSVASSLSLEQNHGLLQSH